MPAWHPLRSVRVVLAAVVVIGATALVATPVGASTTAPGAITTTCGAKTVTSYPAPGVGKTATFTVDSAGAVTLLQKSSTDLKVTSAQANSGWKVNTVTSGITTHPHVGFQRIGVPADQERFWARLNTTGKPGTVIKVIIQSCS